MPNEGQKNVGKKKVLPGLEPGLQGSEPWVLTNYTIEPLMRKVGRGKKKAPRVRLELTTYRLTAGRAADCAIQDFMSNPFVVIPNTVRTINSRGRQHNISPSPPS